ncbi:MAG: hypothetical protein PHX34_01480 [Candidatus Shapirobacteria bacterium]|nr:hypothetical protein [Candidatus Shapirobacteria bacterium]
MSTPESIKDNFYIDPHRQDLEIINTIDYGSGIFMTIRSTKDEGKCEHCVLDINLLHQEIQCIENINNEIQLTKLRSKLFRHYLQPYPSDNLQAHPSICLTNEGINVSNKLPNYILQEIPIF